jgi:hypothetical protein
MKWAYGITTVDKRKDDLLPRTIESLRVAGFDKPILFIDGCKDSKWYKDTFDLEVTARSTAARTFGNWVSALWELYAKTPDADRYAIFQDDFVTYKNLRAYLEQCPYPDKGYLNLYTFPQNEKLAPPNHEGWYLSNQLGKGAVALVFTRDAIVTLLQHPHMVNRPQCAKRGWKAIDGGIVEAFRKSGWKEYVHTPSLVQHTGLLSSMGNRQHSLADSFRGEDFDALDIKIQEAKVSNISEEKRAARLKRHKARWDRFLFSDAIRLLNSIKSKDGVILELGAIRDAREIAARADGHSTVHWAKTNHIVHTVDMSRNFPWMCITLRNYQTNVLF